MDFQILLSPAVDLEGDIVLALSVRPSSFRLSGGLWTTESLPKAHCEVASYHWPSGKAVSCLQRSEESTGYDTQVGP